MSTTNRFRDRTGAVLGRLTVLGYAGTKLVRGRMRATWSCSCSCGGGKVIDSDCLRTVRSCGCLRRETSARTLYVVRQSRPKSPTQPKQQPVKAPVFAELSRRARERKRKPVQPRSYRMRGESRPNTWTRNKLSLNEFSPDSAARKDWFARMELIGRLVAWKHSVRYAANT